MTNQTLIHNVTPEQITSLFQGLQNQIKELNEKFEPTIPVELLTRNEVSKLLKCNLGTLHNWVKKGKLMPYGIGNRVYFKCSEIESVLIPLGKEKEGESE